MSEDMTYCYNLKCKNKACYRHASNIKQYYIPHSYAFFKECVYWDVPEVYFSTSADIKGGQDETN